MACIAHSESELDNHKQALQLLQININIKCEDEGIPEYKVAFKLLRGVGDEGIRRL